VKVPKRGNAFEGFASMMAESVDIYDKAKKEAKSQS